MFLFISFIIFGLIGAIASRLDGGGFFKGPEWLDKFLVTFPYAVIGLLIWWPLSIVCIAGAWAGRALGHGGFYDLGTSPKEPGNGRDKERIEHLIYWLYNRIPRFWYDFMGLSLSGLTVTLIPAIVVACYGHYLSAFILVVSGLLKAPSYAISPGKTEIGEYVNGFQQFFIAGVVIWSLI